MYELFMTAFINDVDFDRAISLLSGYCWSEPSSRIYRVIHYDGPNPPKPLVKTTNIRGIPPQPDPFTYGLPGAAALQPQAGPGPYVDPEWRALSDILRKQSYIVTARWELPKNNNNNNNNNKKADPSSSSGDTSSDPHPKASAPLPPPPPPPPPPSSSAQHAHEPLNARPGALFWAEIPDPASTAGGQSLVMQRSRIEIWDQLNLPAVLADNGFRPRAESLEEAHEIYHRDDPMLGFSLVRHYILPPGTPTAGGGGGRGGGDDDNDDDNDDDDDDDPAPASPFDGLERTDPAGRWILWARVHVHNGGEVSSSSSSSSSPPSSSPSPERISAARDTLSRVRDELRGTGVEFRVLDRRVHDTQLAVRRGPATQTLGRTQNL